MRNPLCNEQYVKSLCRRFGFNFSKSLGQNFLIDENVPADIAESCGADNSVGVIEVGPGMGTLTWELCQRAAHVVAVEVDKTLLPVLDFTLAGFDNVTVINADILKTDINALIEREFYSRGIKRVAVCANLPYYITTPIIMGLLEGKYPIERITVMIQKEVADRLCAKKPGGDSGAVTLAVQYAADTEQHFLVPPTSFIPAPKVTSSVMSLIPLEKPPVEVKNVKYMFHLIREAFALRRKTLANALSMRAGISRDRVTAALEKLSLPADIRGEKLTLEEFARLSDELWS